MLDSLSLVRCGESVPTCGSNQVHTPLIWDFAGQPVRVVIRPNQCTERVVAFVLGDVARSLGYKAVANAADSMNLIDGEDKGFDSIQTPGGPQSIRVLTFKGLTKFLMRSNHSKAVEFQDLLASKASDLAHHGIAFANGSASEILAQNNDDQRFALIESTIQVLAGSVTALATSFTALLEKLSVPNVFGRPITYATKWGTEVLPRRERSTSCAQQKAGRYTAKAYLLQTTGSIKGAHGLCQRTIAHLAGMKDTQNIKRFSRGQSHDTFLPWDALNFVYRHNIRAGNPAPVDHLQGGLFDQAHDQAKRGDIPPFPKE